MNKYNQTTTAWTQLEKQNNEAISHEFSRSHTAKRDHVCIGKNKQTLILIFSEETAH